MSSASSSPRESPQRIQQGSSPNDKDAQRKQQEKNQLKQKLQNEMEAERIAHKRALERLRQKEQHEQELEEKKKQQYIAFTQKQREIQQKKTEKIRQEEARRQEQIEMQLEYAQFRKLQRIQEEKERQRMDKLKVDELTLQNRLLVRQKLLAERKAMHTAEPPDVEGEGGDSLGQGDGVKHFNLTSPRRSTGTTSPTIAQKARECREKFKSMLKQRREEIEMEREMEIELARERAEEQKAQRLDRIQRIRDAVQDNREKNQQLFEKKRVKCIEQHKHTLLLKLMHEGSVHTTGGGSEKDSKGSANYVNGLRNHSPSELERQAQQRLHDKEQFKRLQQEQLRAQKQEQKRLDALVLKTQEDEENRRRERIMEVKRIVEARARNRDQFLTNEKLHKVKKIVETDIYYEEGLQQRSQVVKEYNAAIRENDATTAKLHKQKKQHSATTFGSGIKLKKKSSGNDFLSAVDNDLRAIDQESRRVEVSVKNMMNIA